MSGQTYMPLFIGDYLQDTLHLSTEQHGAYLLLIMAVWSRDGRLIDDDRTIAMVCKLSVKKWRAMAPIIRPYFIATEDGFLEHKRINEERNKQAKISAKRSEAGKKACRKSATRIDSSRSLAEADLFEKANGFNEGAAANDFPTRARTKPSKDIDSSLRSESISKNRSPDGSRQKTGSRMPDDFEPDRQAATDIGLSPVEADREAAKFRDYWRGVPGARGRKLDWPATWRNWCRKALESRPRGRSPPVGELTMGDAFRRHAAEAMRQEQDRDDERFTTTIEASDDD